MVILLKKILRHTLKIDASILQVSHLIECAFIPFLSTRTINTHKIQPFCIILSPIQLSWGSSEGY